MVSHDDGGDTARRLVLTPASAIKVLPVRWLWDLRMALGCLVLLGGREGIGKSTFAYWLVAAITRGLLPGAFFGVPRTVAVGATEDSWAHTITPRLIGAGADLDRVLRVEVQTAAGFQSGLSLPVDLDLMAEAIAENDVALVLLDPLMSRLDAKLDTHKDAEVRQALEPLVRLADQSKVAVLGLIHVNKSHGNDPLTALMGSRAFAAVARQVLFVMSDPDDDSVRLLGLPKNNLGRTDLPTLTFGIESAHVADTDEGPIYTGRVKWLGETERQIRDVMESAGETTEARTAVGEAAAWLGDYLTSVGGTADSATVKEEGRKAGHTKDALARARKRTGVHTESEGFPRRTFWRLPPAVVVAPSHRSSGESATTTTTATTGAVDAVDAVVAVMANPQDRAPTEHCTECGGRLDPSLIAAGFTDHGERIAS